MGNGVAEPKNTIQIQRKTHAYNHKKSTKRNGKQSCRDHKHNTKTKEKSMLPTPSFGNPFLPPKSRLLNLDRARMTLLKASEALDGTPSFVRRQLRQNSLMNKTGAKLRQ